MFRSLVRVNARLQPTLVALEQIGLSGVERLLLPNLEQTRQGGSQISG